jgi:nucleoside-diphosphate-sugar epimerase
MKLLILGGTHFAGRAIVEAALADGIELTMLNRGNTTIPGLSGKPVRTLIADRTDPDALRAALGDQEWDAVIDTWSWAPSVVAASCELLKGRTGHYGYVSTLSVYADPIPQDAKEDAPTVAADPDDDQDWTDGAGYQRVKRGSELAVLRTFGDGALLARAGLILGPYENVGRLPWWLRRIERGGKVLAPDGPDVPVQYVDVRDLARWMLDMAKRRAGGAFNVVNKSGETTRGQFLSTAIAVTGSDAELVWVPEQVILDAKLEPWTELPLWMPRDWDEPVDVSAAFAAGLTGRTAQETVTDTWAWLQAEGDPQPRRQPGLPPEKEQAVLAQFRSILLRAILLRADPVTRGSCYGQSCYGRILLRSADLAGSRMRGWRRLRIIRIG